MKLRLLVLASKCPDWVEAARDEYTRKLKGFLPFTIEIIKSPKLEKDLSEVKRLKEAELILKRLEPGQTLVLFDEAGKTFARSEDFAQATLKLLESGKSEIVFCIGGAYGFDPSVLKRSQAKWSLSGLTMNHYVAQLMALEQLYRAMTIIKSIPYHNR